MTAIFRETNLKGYKTLDKELYPNYKINVEKGYIIKKTTKRIVGHQSKTGNLFTHLFNSSTGKYDYSKYIHKLVWNFVNGSYDKNKFLLKHIDNNYFNNSINNLELVPKGYQRRMVKIIILKNLKTKEKTKYNSISQCSLLSGIGYCSIASHLKSGNPIKDKEGNLFKIKSKVKDEYNTAFCKAINLT